jgi:hypothetical protein
VKNSLAQTISTFYKKGFQLRLQKPGLPADGPLAPWLAAMSATGSGDQPISPVGAEVARLFSGRKTRVVYMHTAGSGITPWRRLIVLDADYRDPSAWASPAKVGLVAHELTHLLQRDLKPNQYWPSGGLRPSLSRRWVGDSTSFMEVVAYLVGWTVEYDLTAVRAHDSGLPEDVRQRSNRALPGLRDRLATLSGPDVSNAVRLVLKIYPDNGVYRQNYRLESRLPDGRIPPGSWHAWLGRMGFARAALDHIWIVAAQGHLQQIDPVAFV